MPTLSRISTAAIIAFSLGACDDWSVAAPKVAPDHAMAHERFVTAAGKDEAACVPAGRWLDPQTMSLRPVDTATSTLASKRVVLLGEVHTSAEDHRWQLHTMAALHGRRPDMVLGFEMFPRAAQPILDRWVAGELTEKQFLEQTDWDKVWNVDAGLYMPLFHFARQHRVPMVALNVDQALIARVGQEGWTAVPEGERAGISTPAPASDDYRRFLRTVFEQHAAMRSPHAEDPGGNDEAEDKAQGEDPDGNSEAEDKAQAEDHERRFENFTDSQLTWDRAMAEALAGPARGADAPLVVGIMGGGHLFRRFGVPHQLADLGIDDVGVAIPWNSAFSSCDELTEDYADLLFGIQPPPATEEEKPQRPLLGVRIDDEAGSVKVTAVMDDSVAEKAGLREGDIIAEAAGTAVNANATLIRIVRRQAPGTWLPLAVHRDGESLDMVAKFPAPVDKP